MRFWAEVAWEKEVVAVVDKGLNFISVVKLGSRDFHDKFRGIMAGVIGLQSETWKCTCGTAEGGVSQYRSLKRWNREQDSNVLHNSPTMLSFRVSVNERAL